MAPSQLLPTEPYELREFSEHLQSLDFYGRPDYERMRRMFAKILARFQISDESPMDWEPLALDEDVGDQNRRKQESEKSEHGDENVSIVSERGVNEMDG